MPHQIPDPIEPAFLKNKNDAIIEDYTNAALQLKEDPMMAVELMAQSMSDTVEEEGVMYVSGSALTYLIPTSLFVKFIKEGSAVKGVGKARVKDGKGDKESKNTIDNIDGIKVIDEKVNGKVPIDNYKQIRIESVHNVDSDSLTLGKYTPTIENGVENWGKAGPDSYIGRAGNDSTYFDLGDHWDKVQKRYDLTDKEMFELFNVPVLDDAVKGGKEIRFSHDPRVDEYKTSYLRKEWEYLQETYNYKTLKNKGDVFIAK